MYYVYIPFRLQKGAGEGGLILHEVRLKPVEADSVGIFLNATQSISEPPPVPIYMSKVLFTVASLGPNPPPEKTKPSLFPPRVPASWEPEDRRAHVAPVSVAMLQFPGLVTPVGASTVPVIFDSAFTGINSEYLTPFITALVRDAAAGTFPPDHPVRKHSVLEPATFRQQGVPTMSIPKVGSWLIPMWTYFRFDPAAVPPAPPGDEPKKDPYDARVDDQSVAYDPVDLPDGTQVAVLAVNLSCSFTNPHPISIAPQGFTVHLSIHHNGTRLLNVEMPLTREFGVGRNTGVVVRAKGDPLGGEALADWIGLYAEGIDTVLTVRDVRLEYEQGRARLGWVDEMVQAWDVDIYVPGANEEDA
ncbi:hypothetical protein HK101_003931 [Irineochytrium annulatum]|nr:hypothetical protein HK101_003931 [Irineochytrium annulatum]